MKDYTVTHLKHLESEAIYVLRETVAQFNKPALLFSGGKDSIIMTHLAVKAFWPAKLPFPLVHIDTGHNFSETMEYRDGLAHVLGAETPFTGRAVSFFASAQVKIEVYFEFCRLTDQEPSERMIKRKADTTAHRK